MSEKITLARPYAEAVFRLAEERRELKRWSEMLALMAAVAADPQIVSLSADPRVARERFLDLFLDVCGKTLNQDGANFVRLLQENRRLALLPEIAALFEESRAVAERRIEAQVVSAFEMTAEQIKQIAAALEKKLGRKIDLKPAVDATLIGGVVIRAGDLVIDGSMRGRLRALGSYLNH